MLGEDLNAAFYGIADVTKGVDQAIKKTSKSTKGFFKKTGKDMKGLFKAMGGSMGIFGMILQVLDSLGVLKPLLTILNAVVKIIGGKVMAKLAPVIMKFLDVLMSAPFMALFDAIASMLISILIPAMEVIMMVLEALAPILPFMSEVLMMLGEAIGELLLMLFSTPEFLVMIMGLMWALYGIIHAIIFVIRIFIVIFTFVRTTIIIVVEVVKWIIVCFIALFQIFKSGGGLIKTVIGWIQMLWDTIAGIFGGGSKKGKQYGGTIAQSGVYYLHAGEEVKTTEKVGMANEDMLQLQEETLDEIKKMNHYLMYGV